MSHYVIAGKPDCSKFVHVAYVCEYLKHQLPNFKYTKIQIKSGEWKYWLNDKNVQNGWNHTVSPLIWKEISRAGGKPYLIGSISDFWEHCYDYYGLESLLPKDDLDNLVEDNKQFFKKIEEEQEKVKANRRVVTVLGVTFPMYLSFLPELLQIENLCTSEGLVLRLFDPDLELQDDLNYVIDLMDALSEMTLCVLLVCNFQQALENCDLLINIHDDSPTENETEEGWYIRNMYTMLMIADNINMYAKKSLKILFANPGAPCCFNASVITQNCTSIKLSNVVVVTADWGDCALNLVSKECNIPLAELGAPPVWGIWTSHFVDVGSIIKKCDIPRPYLRAVKTSGGSTLPLGKMTSELRYINYLTDRITNIETRVRNIRATTVRKLGRAPTYSKVKAAMKVLKIWFSGKPSDEIISLGVCSNGSFGFPPGIVVSQPAIFDGKSWVPFKNFPVREYSKRRINRIIPHIVKLLRDFEVNGP